MRRGLVLALALAVVAVGSPAGADHSANPPPPMDADRITNEPAASLLLPFFKVALPDKPGGEVSGPNTVMSIVHTGYPGLANANVHPNFASASLAHVTLWSDVGMPVLSFDVYFTGFDAVKIDLRRVIEGHLPQTASDGQDPADTNDPRDGISNQGPFSQDINFATCDGILPPPKLSKTVVAHNRAALTGRTSPLTGKAYGIRHPGRALIARGFVTVDDVTQCSLLFPTDPGYFAGVASLLNMYTGDYVQTDGGKTYGDTLVHIRTNYNGGNDPEIGVPGQYTFYGRAIGWNASDHRQPLGSVFAPRFQNTPKAKTHLVVWRDPKVSAFSGFTPGSPPTWIPMSQSDIVAFDDQENVQSVNSAPFGIATQQVRVGGATLPTTFRSGWLFLNLNLTQASAGAVPPENPAAAQAWVTSVFSRRGGTPVTAPHKMIEGAASTTDPVLIP